MNRLLNFPLMGQTTKRNVPADERFQGDPPGNDYGVISEVDAMPPELPEASTCQDDNGTEAWIT